MNAPAFPKAGAPVEPLTATFRVRQRTAMLYVVERAISGGDAATVERSWFECGRAHAPDDANAQAERYAAAWRTRTGAVAVVEPFPKLGRQPGRLYTPCFAARNNHVRFHEDLGIEAKFVGRL